MKSLTSGVISYVIGKANGTGIPQFVVDVKKSMQTVSDAQWGAYMKQINQTKSPFSYSIASALNTDYLKKTSLAGFWAQNMSTLSRSSPNVRGYLAGDWRQGGVGAWFALTTRPENNPYMLYQNTQAQLAAVIGPGVAGATGARQQELAWGQGFMSWCSASDATNAASNDAWTKMTACQAQCTSQSCINNCERSNPIAAGGDARNGSGPVGINPGDPCIDKDGKAGTTQTPGSTIKATLDKVLGAQQDKLINMGNIGPQINQTLANVAKIYQTVHLAKEILGGGTKGGLLNAGQPSGHLTEFTPPRDTQGNFTQGYAGATNESITSSARAADAATNAASDAQAARALADAARESAALDVKVLDMTARARLYQTSWNTIAAATNATKTTVTSLINTCAAQAVANPENTQFVVESTAQAAAARVAITTEMEPILSQAAVVPQIVAAAIAQDARVKQELASSSPAYEASLQTLKTMSPTVEETTQAQQDAKLARRSPVSPYASLSEARATPPGSLTVAASTNVSIVDQMSLISTNAATLATTVCTPNGNGGGNGGGGGDGP
jgi:hypothetical protein